MTSHPYRGGSPLRRNPPGNFRGRRPAVVKLLAFIDANPSSEPYQIAQSVRVTVRTVLELVNILETAGVLESQWVPVPDGSPRQCIRRRPGVS